MATMIDTLGYVKKLTAAGFSREQAEAQAEAFRDDIATQVTTKADLDALGLRLEHKIDNLEVRFDGKLTLLHWMCGFTLALCLAMLWMMVRIATGK
jgi:type VI protein secretion system component VasF